MYTRTSQFRCVRADNLPGGYAHHFDAGLRHRGFSVWELHEPNLRTGERVLASRIPIYSLRQTGAMWLFSDTQGTRVRTMLSAWWAYGDTVEIRAGSSTSITKRSMSHINSLRRMETTASKGA